MACAELVLPGDFDHSHHGGSGLGSGCAHTVSLYRQELGEVQALGDRRCDAVGVHGWKCCRVERRAGRSACATWTGAKHREKRRRGYRVKRPRITIGGRTGRGRSRMKTCTHLDQIRDVKPLTPNGCEECLKMGDTWVHLRLCLECGHVGCCDSSKNKHATKHFHRTKHPIMKSFEPGENWGWCYIDEVELDSSSMAARA